MKFVKIVSQIHLIRKRLNSQMEAVVLKMKPCFCANYSEISLFIFPNTYGKYMVSRDYDCCFALHKDKMCFLPNCRYHITLKRDIEGLKNNACCFGYQHVDCLYALFKYQFSGKDVVKSGQFFEIEQRAVNSMEEQKEWPECPASRKRDLLGKSAEALTKLFPKDKMNSN